jgi:hypothetical protein
VSTCHAPWIIRIGDVPLIFMVPSILYWTSKVFLANCTPHCTICRMEWQFHIYVVSQRPRTSFSNFMSINPFEVEMGWFSKLHAVWGGYFMMYTLVHSVCYVCLHAPDFPAANGTPFYFAHWSTFTCISEYTVHALLVDLSTLSILNGLNRMWSSSYCSFLEPAVVLCILDVGTSAMFSNIHCTKGR